MDFYHELVLLSKILGFVFFFFAIAGLLMGFGVRQRWGRAAAMETQWEGGTDKIWTEGGRVWDSSVVPDGEK